MAIKPSSDKSNTELATELAYLAVSLQPETVCDDLEEASLRLNAMGWQPIATAPLDKQEVDIWVVWPSGTATRIPDSFHVEGRGWFLGQSFTEESLTQPRATHWMSKPSGPVPKGA